MAARKHCRAPFQNSQMGLLTIIGKGSTAIKMAHTRKHNKILEDKTRTLIRPSDHDLPNQMYGAKTRLRPLRASCLFTRSRIYTCFVSKPWRNNQDKHAACHKSRAEARPVHGDIWWTGRTSVRFCWYKFFRQKIKCFFVLGHNVYNFCALIYTTIGPASCIVDIADRVRRARSTSSSDRCMVTFLYVHTK